MMLGLNNYAVLLIPIKACQAVQRRARSHIGRNADTGDPFDDSHATGRSGMQNTTYNASESDYIYLSTTLHTSTLPPHLATIYHIKGPKAISESQWIEYIHDLLIADKAPAAIIRAAREDVITGSTGAWPIAAADEAVPTVHDLRALAECAEEDEWKRRVVLVGDAAHAMPPQGYIYSNLADPATRIKSTYIAELINQGSWGQYSAERCRTAGPSNTRQSGAGR
jgi:hypothetical protein